MQLKIQDAIEGFGIHDVAHSLKVIVESCRWGDTIHKFCSRKDF